MSVFEYVFAFLTLVLGLGLARNLTAIAGANARLILNVEPTVGPVLAAFSLVLALFSKTRLVPYRIGTLGFLGFSIFLLGFVGPTTIG